MSVVNEQVLYNNDERYLLGFHRRHVVDSDSESTRENYKDYVKMRFKSLAEADSKDRFERQTKRILDKIKSKQ